MFKMSYTCEYHCYLPLVAAINRIVVAYRAAGLYNGADACIGCQMYAVGEREKGVACHHRALEVEIEISGFFDGVF
jgi:hypothetical protein